MPGGIDQQRLDDCIATAVTQALEMMCFAVAEPVEESAMQDRNVIARQIEFRGDASGDLRFVIETDSARLLAGNFYGMDPLTLEELQVEAVVGELTNVVCGGMLSLLAPDGRFDLSPPQELTSAAPHAGAFERAFAVDASTLVVSVLCRNSQCSSVFAS
jgi:CheY-specific phosphatase CheX